MIKTLQKSLGITSKEGKIELSNILKTIDSNTDEGWHNDAFWKKVFNFVSKQNHTTDDTENLYPGLKKQIKNTPMKISDDLRQITDFTIQERRTSE